MTAVLLLSATLLAYGWALNRLGWARRLAYVPLNLGVAGLLVAAGRRQGLTWAELGVGVGSGLAWGLALTAVVGLGLAVAVAVPGLRRFLADRRMAGLSAGELAYQVGFRIPLGTALAEEVVFRGVLLGWWGAEAGVGTGVVGSSVVFGLWHVAPTLEVIRLNRPAAGLRTLALGAAGAVLATTGAGIGLCWLRLATGGVVGPAVLHAGVNSLAALASHRVQRGPG